MLYFIEALVTNINMHENPTPISVIFAILQVLYLTKFVRFKFSLFFIAFTTKFSVNVDVNVVDVDVEVDYQVANNIKARMHKSLPSA